MHLRKLKHFSFTIFFIFNYAYWGFAQSNTIKNLNFRANDFFNAGLFQKALKEYLTLDSLSPNNADIKYKIGLCYLKTVEKSKALKYLLSASELGFKSDGFEYNLAQGYHAHYDFEKAIEHYKEALNKIGNNAQNTIDLGKMYSIKHLIKNCETAKELIRKPLKTKIVNMGSAINSPYPEYSPLVDIGETKIYFTTRRPNNLINPKAPPSELYPEDIWIASKANDSDSFETKPLPEPINSIYHDATAALSADGKSMIIYRKENLYITIQNQLQWSKPMLLPKTINTDFWESSASISSDGNTIYFSSNKKGGYGGKDIYKSHKLTNGSWSEAQNCGANINTAFDEEAPFIHQGNKLLYFSSNRPESFGGFDIFYSKIDSNKQYQEAQNMGYPVNSIEDDLDFVWSADGTRAYFSSDRAGGMGMEDIYMMTLDVPSQPLKVLLGEIVDEFNQPLNANLEIVELDNKQVFNKKTIQCIEGKFTCVIENGKKYALYITAKNKMPYSENLDFISDTSYQEIKKKYVLSSITSGSKSQLNNIFFDTNKDDLKDVSLPELNNLVLFLKQNDVSIVVQGHTDNIGDKEYNLMLSQKRAIRVKTFLETHGINSNRIEIKGLGDTEPIADNNTEQGRKLNRRITIYIN